MQSAAEDELWVVLNLPEAQLEQDAAPSPLYVPAAQLRHKDAPLLLYLPAVQEAQVVGLVALCMALYLPAAQGVQQDSLMPPEPHVLYLPYR